MAEIEQIQQDFLSAEAKLLKALEKLDGVIGGTVENFGKLKKELLEKRNQQQPLLSNEQILVLQEENKKLRKEYDQIRQEILAEKNKNQKLLQLKLDVSDKIENLIGQLEKVA